MKRSVAIYGPTPQFVRWAILHDCPFRDVDVDNLPDRTFRQLRGVREFSRAKTEARVFEDYCLHPEVASDEPQRARGFHQNEVLAALGEPEFVAKTCRQCPANALSDLRSEAWAGCYGVLAATSGFDFETLVTSSVDFDNLGSYPLYQPGRFDFVELIEQAFDELPQEVVANLFPPTSPRWFGIWKNGGFAPQQLRALGELLNLIVRRCLDLDALPAEIREVVQLKSAVDRCIKFDLVLSVELVPPGHSDGMTWVINSHCPDCKMSMLGDVDRCLACGRVGGAQGIRKSRVLGSRPYVNLDGVLGEKKTVELLARYEQGKKNT
ncbi:MAG: hypothetical protein P8L78_12535 [Mariniblastus sp.]|nr:hypothetical protein [Mariniblastus sp.]